MHRPMISGVETEPRWLRNVCKVFEFTFKLSFILTGLLSVFIILYFLFGGLFITDDGGPDSHSEWCEEYHPKLTFSECSDMAGW